MGDYQIRINGTGAHHNSKFREGDADALAREFVAKLQAAGHDVKHASIFIVGGSSESLLADVPPGTFAAPAAVAEPEAAPEEGDESDEDEAPEDEDAEAE